MHEFLRIAAGSFQLYAVEQTAHSLILLAAGLVLASLLGFGLVVWVRLFNRSYSLRAPQICLAVVACLLCAAMAPLWFALNYAGRCGDTEVRALLRSLSEDPTAMAEIRGQTQHTLAVEKNLSHPDASTNERWQFSMAPDDGSILTLANAYTESLSAVLARRSGLLSKFLSWGSAPGFVAADIRMHMLQNPSEPYDLDPGRKALADILTLEFLSHMQSAVFVLRILGGTILILLILVILGWLALAAYRDIHVHWPSEI